MRETAKERETERDRSIEPQQGLTLCSTLSQLGYAQGGLRMQASNLPTWAASGASCFSAALPSGPCEQFFLSLALWCPGRMLLSGWFFSSQPPSAWLRSSFLMQLGSVISVHILFWVFYTHEFSQCYLGIQNMHR